MKIIMIIKIALIIHVHLFPKFIVQLNGLCVLLTIILLSFLSKYILPAIQLLSLFSDPIYNLSSIFISSYSPKSQIRIENTCGKLNAYGHKSDRCPAAKAHNNRLAAFSDELCNIGVKTYGAHCHSYKKFSKPFHSRHKAVRIQDCHSTLRNYSHNCSYDRCQYKVEYEHREYTFYRKTAAFAVCLFSLCCFIKSQHKSNGDYGKSSCELYRNSRGQYAVNTVYTFGSRCCSSNR